MNRPPLSRVLLALLTPSLPLFLDRPSSHANSACRRSTLPECAVPRRSCHWRADGRRRTTLPTCMRIRRCTDPPPGTTPTTTSRPRRVPRSRCAYLPACSLRATTFDTILLFASGNRDVIVGDTPLLVALPAFAIPPSLRYSARSSSCLSLLRLTLTDAPADAIHRFASYRRSAYIATLPAPPVTEERPSVATLPVVQNARHEHLDAGAAFAEGRLPVGPEDPTRAVLNAVSYQNSR
ncbi:hypothetical protein DFH07DRAFT_1054476 [Mycena maculata]|uniref:Uncharacterized protein n=1 Tax=Mycena maculata TaxID=230809 RepID=A0AAD7KHV3_9AGAR|nr:hypothetical protein DFH07DRAFT_1054476 [Mycena maculata]